MSESFLDGRMTLLRGDCLELLPTLAENSIDSCVTDPPYGLQFMGREWDKLWRNETKADAAYVERTKGQLTSRSRKLPDYSATKPAQMQEFHLAWAKECLRVLKPGAHLLAFSGTRTYHRMACAIEDAGFEIRDQIGWCYGSGFPKSHDISKAIDRMAGAERQEIGRGISGKTAIWSEDGGMGDFAITAPATDSAIQWQGWGTALKPAWEPIVLARKPISESSIAANVLKHGTGAINIGGCRVESGESTERPSGVNGNIYGADNRQGIIRGSTLGRWPANLIHDGSEEVVRGFPDALGQQRATGPQFERNANVYGKFAGVNAARFFYTAKADLDDRLGSKHPTVKPLDLMQYLCRLITPKGGTVLDPFAGTGTTGEAAWREGFRSVLIEREEEYQADIVKRMGFCLSGPNERRAASVKQAGLDDTPLFGET